MRLYIILLFIGLVTKANASVLFHNVTLKGSGCDESMTASIISPDGTALSLVFDNYLLDSGESEGSFQTYFNKTCQIEIETEIPVGHRIKKVDMAADFRGFLFLDQGVRASFIAQMMEWVSPESRFSSRKRKLLVKEDWSVLRGDPLEEDLFLTGSKQFVTPHGDCSSARNQKSKVVLRTMLSSRIIPAFAHLDPQFTIMLDSADLSGSLQIELQTEECTPGSPSRGSSGRGRGSRYSPPQTRPNPGNSGRANPCRGNYHWDQTIRRCVRN